MRKHLPSAVRTEFAPSRPVVLPYSARHLSNRGDVFDKEQMPEAEFHRLADVVLDECMTRVEDLGLEDWSMDDGVLKIETLDGKHFVINKHFMTQQIWYSSPVSGALYFDPPFHDLMDVLIADLRQCGVVAV